MVTDILVIMLATMDNIPTKVLMSTITMKAMSVTPLIIDLCSNINIIGPQLILVLIHNAKMILIALQWTNAVLLMKKKAKKIYLIHFADKYQM